MKTNYENQNRSSEEVLRAISARSDLTEIKISQVQFRPSEVGSFIEAIGKQTNLVSLDLSDATIDTDGKGADKLIEALKGNKSLTSLNLTGHIVDEQKIVELLNKNPNIVEYKGPGNLGLQNNKAIKQALESNQNNKPKEEIMSKESTVSFMWQSDGTDAIGTISQETRQKRPQEDDLRTITELGKPDIALPKILDGKTEVSIGITHLAPDTYNQKLQKTTLLEEALKLNTTVVKLDTGLSSAYTGKIEQYLLRNELIAAVKEGNIQGISDIAALTSKDKTTERNKDAKVESSTPANGIYKHNYQPNPKVEKALKAEIAKKSSKTPFADNVLEKVDGKNVIDLINANEKLDAKQKAEAFTTVLNNCEKSKQGEVKKSILEATSESKEPALQKLSQDLKGESFSIGKFLKNMFTPSEKPKQAQTPAFNYGENMIPPKTVNANKRNSSLTTDAEMPTSAPHTPTRKDDRGNNRSIP